MSVQLIHGDCLEVMRTLPHGCVDSIVTDPPYKDYQTSWYNATEWHRPVMRVPPSRYAKLFYDLLASDCALLVWLTWESFEEHRQAFARVGFKVLNRIVWGKPNHTAGDLEGNLGNQYEEALFAVKGDWKRHGKRETNLWLEPHLFSRAYRHHPTEKPVNLMCRSVRLACPEGGFVLDPFMGSGTTGIACLSEDRYFIGIEKDEGYFRIAEARIKRAQGQPCDIPRRVVPEKDLPLFRGEAA